MADSIEHFSHPEHLLLLTYRTNTFRCDLCYKSGTGLRYRCECEECDFDLHESCTTFPQILSFSAHPWHKIMLANHSASTVDPSTCCDLCSEPVKGFFYKCEPCGFNLHPHCSLSPSMVNTKFHPDHSLMLVPTAGSCSACKQNLTVWTYRCGICSVNLHYNCFLNSSGNDRGSIADNSAKASRKTQGR